MTPALPPASLSFVDSARRTLHTERQALQVLEAELDEHFDQACALMLGCQGRIVVTGMGKSGHIGRKIAATLASTGTPAFFMHPGEAAHGDLGMLVAGDVLLAISNSGESDEIMRLLPVVKRYGIPLITISRDRRAAMPQAADVALTLGRAEEACPLGLAPTSSTTATLALGDALAIALLESRGFTTEDFALSHPAGALGRRLLTRISDVMHLVYGLLDHGSTVRRAPHGVLGHSTCVFRIIGNLVNGGGQLLNRRRHAGSGRRLPRGTF